MRPKVNNGLLILVALFSIIFSSCGGVYFTQPQPVDKANLKKFPGKIQGMWVNGGGKYGGAYFEKFDTIIVSKKFYQESNTSEYYLSREYIDSDSGLVIRNGLIYDMSEDSTEGYPFIIRSDSMFVQIHDVKRVDLDDSAVLRRLTKNRFILSYTNSDHEEWWNLYLIERMKDGTIVCREVSRKHFEHELGLLSNATGIDSTQLRWQNIQGSEFELQDNKFYKENRFIKADINAAALNEFIDMGGFMDTIMILKPENRIE